MKKALKWTGIGLGSAVVLLALAAFVANRVGASNVDAVHEVSVASLTVPTDSASVAHGAHLAGIYGCRDCHGDDLSGQVMGEGGPFLLVASNLTPAGVGAEYGPEDWDRAIRHGVRIDGRAVTVMPSGAYHGISDSEAADLIAYLETLDPAGEQLPRVSFTTMGHVLAAGPLDPTKNVRAEPTTATSPPAGATVEYGAYIAEMMCAYCHGAGLVGGEPEGPPGSPPPPDLGAAGQWPTDQFHETLTTGVLPDGRRMDPEVMPWTSTARMTHDEREGLRRYLSTLAASRATDA